MSCKALQLNNCEIFGSTFKGRKFTLTNRNEVGDILTAKVKSFDGTILHELVAEKIDSDFYFSFSDLELLKVGGYKIEYWLDLLDVAKEMIAVESFRVSQEPCNCEPSSLPTFSLDFGETVISLSIELTIVNIGGGGVGGSSVTDFSYDEATETLSLKQTNNRNFEVLLPKGRDGRDGIDGINGVDGKDGKDGVNGQDGYTPIKGVDYFDGKDGESAYQLAIKNGFIGTLQDWLDSLKGTGGNPPKKTFDVENNTDSATMKATFDASIQLVDNALANYYSDFKTIGKDLHHVAVTSATNYPKYLFNKLTAPTDGRFTTFKFWVGNVAKIQYFHINYDEATNTVVEKGSWTIDTIAGINEVKIDLKAVKGDTIAIRSIGAEIGYTDNVPNYFYSTGQAVVKFLSGYIAYTVELATKGNAGYSTDDLIKLLKNGNPETSEPSGDTVKTGIKASRITIEGQSNALGVGYKSGLLNAPFSSQLLDWNKAFSRVFIWNPKSDAYENITIGVNNMASWDKSYTVASPTPQPTFGPEIGIALAWLQTNKQGCLFIDKNVGDGKPISYFQSGTAYYTEKLARKVKSDKWLKDRGYIAEDIGFVWVQGEADMGALTVNYLNALNSLIASRIADGFINNSTIRVIAQVNATSANYGVGVKSAKDSYVASDLRARIITYTNNMNSDNVHLNTAGQINLGLDAGKEIFQTEKMLITDVESKESWTF